MKPHYIPFTDSDSSIHICREKKTIPDNGDFQWRKNLASISPYIDIISAEKYSHNKSPAGIEM